MHCIVGHTHVLDNVEYIDADYRWMRGNVDQSECGELDWWVDYESRQLTWRHRRLAVRVTLIHGYDFLDVESPQTHEALTTALAPQLSSLGVSYLDVPTVRGPDRRVTRLISDWAVNVQAPDGGYLYAGIRYVSRLGDYEC